MKCWPPVVEAEQTAAARMKSRSVGGNGTGDSRGGGLFARLSGAS